MLSKILQFGKSAVYVRALGKCSGPTLRVCNHNWLTSLISELWRSGNPSVVTSQHALGALKLRSLFIATAVIEAGAAVALLCVPAVAISALFGAEVEISTVLVSIARITGTALGALGVANWFVRDATQSAAATGLVIGMLIYNLGAVAIFSTSSLIAHQTGPALWPAVVLHSIMSVWCLMDLAKGSSVKK